MSLLDDTGVSNEARVVQRVRDGDAAAFGVLYQRHLGAARRLARSLLADPSDADDVVAEVFAATFAAMRKGRGPAADVRPYVLTSVRRECQRTWRRSGRQRPCGDTVVELVGGRDDLDERTEDELVQQILASMPDRLRDVLWATEVEGRSHADIAAGTGSTGAAVAQLAVRARRAFGERYLDAHLPRPAGPTPTECVAARAVLAEVVRGTASTRQRRLVTTHTATCAACADASDELAIVNRRLRSGRYLALASVAAARPARVGLLAKLGAWIAGSVPVVTASVAVVLVAVVAPEPQRPTAMSPAAVPVAPAAPSSLVPVTTVPEAPTTTAASRPAPAHPAAPQVTTAAVPEAATVPDVAPTDVPAPPTTVAAALPEVPVAPVVDSAIGQVPPAHVDVQLPDTPVVGTVAADVGVDGGLTAAVTVGPAQASLTVAPSGVAADVTADTTLPLLGG